jgi:hypothetical protein
MNHAKIIGIANRIRVTPPANRQPLIRELLAAIDEGPSYTANRELVRNDLRGMLDWPEVKSDPVALACVARRLNQMRC